MSKEYLEAFKNLKKELYYSPNQIPDVDKWHEIIEQALQRLESIDNTNPSEALKLVDELDSCLISDMSIEVDDYDESNYCMSYEYVDFNGEGLQFNDDIKEETIIDFIREKKISIIKQALLNNQKENNILKVLKPLCKVKETPEKTVRYLLVSGTVAYVFKEIEEYEMFKEWLKDE